MQVSLTVGKVDAGVTVLLTPDRRVIEFPSILLPPNIVSGSIVNIDVSRNMASESQMQREFRALQDQIYRSFGAASPATPVLRCRNATQTSVVLEWDPIRLATADLVSLSLFRNGQKAGNIPRPTTVQSTKISGLAVDTEYTFHLVLRTTAGTCASEKVVVRTHKMTDLSGITITTGILPASAREALQRAVERIGARVADGVRIDTTHFVTTEGRGVQWEKANEMNIPVVRPEWVEACERTGRILGVTKFYLDAVRTLGAPVEDVSGRQHSQPQPRTPKDLPSPSTNVNDSRPSAADEPAAHRKEEDGESAKRHEESSSDESENHIRRGRAGARSDSGGQDEPAGRLDNETLEQHRKLALRPRPTVEDEKDDDAALKSSGGDASSFQDVAL